MFEIPSSFNKFKFIQHFLFYDLENLRSIDLSNNQISFIHPHTFQQLKDLQVLDLSSNHLTTFNPDWVKTMAYNGAININLMKNPWSCDCGMKEAIKFMQDPANTWFTNLNDASILCANPEQTGIANQIILYPTAFKEVLNSNLENLKCQPPTISGISKASTIKAGKTVLLRCIAEGLPKPSIAWISPENDVYRLNTDNFKGITVREDGSLSIKDLKESDSGTYICQATSNLGGSNNNVIQVGTTLTVAKPESDIQENNHMLVGSKSLDGGKNKSVHSTNEHCPESCDCSSNTIDCSLNPSRNQRIREMPTFSREARKILNTTAKNFYLMNNLIEKIERPVCAGLSSLVDVKFDYNSIYFITTNAFRNCDHLNSLSLRQNLEKNEVLLSF